MRSIMMLCSSVLCLLAANHFSTVVSDGIDAIKGPHYLQSKNYPEHYFGSDKGREFKIVKNGVKLKIVSGLTGDAGSVSFESADTPGQYLRHINYLIDMEKKAGARNAHIFDQDATFYPRENKFYQGYYSFESVNFPDYYIRHQGYRLKISKQDGSSLYKNDASFKLIVPEPEGSACELDDIKPAPTCEDNGDYKLKQCNANKCWCVDAKTGTKTYAQKIPLGENYDCTRKPEKCERKRFKKVFKDAAYTPLCNSNGTYMRKQCIEKKGVKECFCVKKKSGKKVNKKDCLDT